MIAFIDDNRELHGPIRLRFGRSARSCRQHSFGAPSTYRKHVAQQRDPLRLSARARRDLALKPEIARVFAKNFAVYGVRKVWRQMRREGFSIARCTVERLMRDMGLCPAPDSMASPIRSASQKHFVASWEQTGFD